MLIINQDIIIGESKFLLFANVLEFPNVSINKNIQNIDNSIYTVDPVSKGIVIFPLSMLLKIPATDLTR